MPPPGKTTPVLLGYDNKSESQNEAQWTRHSGMNSPLALVCSMESSAAGGRKQEYDFARLVELIVGRLCLCRRLDSNLEWLRRSIVAEFLLYVSAAEPAEVPLFSPLSTAKLYHSGESRESKSERENPGEPAFSRAGAIFPRAESRPINRRPINIFTNQLLSSLLFSHPQPTAVQKDTTAIGASTSRSATNRNQVAGDERAH